MQNKFASLDFYTIFAAWKSKCKGQRLTICFVRAFTMATTPTANTHHNFRNGNKAGQMQCVLTSTDTNSNGQKERCKMIEEVVIYHDDNAHGRRAELQIHKNFVEICINDDSSSPVLVQFDTETAYMFAKDILRKVEQIEKDQE